jgi:hypothetical protein
LQQVQKRPVTCKWKKKKHNNGDSPLRQTNACGCQEGRPDFLRVTDASISALSFGEFAYEISVEARHCAAPVLGKT